MGEPVGSKLLATATGLGLSSATIRNEMSDLAELGYLEQPHTSAGRIPTQKGYRLYVDSLMGSRHLTPDEMRHIDELLRIDEGDMERTLAAAGRALAEITGFAAVSTAPRDQNAVLRKIDCIPCGIHSALLVLLSGTGVIKSKLCRSAEELTPEMLRFFSRLADERLSGLPLADITPEKLETLTGELYEYTCALRPLLAEIARLGAELMSSEVFLGGETNLLRREAMMTENAGDLLSALEQREVLASLLEGIRDGVEVRIGTENSGSLAQVDVISLVASPYDFNGKPAGTLGVIGPTRMNYAKIIPCLAYFSEVLSRLINNHFGTL